MLGKGDRSLSVEASNLSSSVNPSPILSPPPPVPPRDYFNRTNSGRSSLDNKSCKSNCPDPVASAVVLRSSAITSHPPPPRKSPPPLPPGAPNSANSNTGRTSENFTSLASILCIPQTSLPPLIPPSGSLLAPVAVPAVPTHLPPPPPPSMPLIPPPVPSPRPSSNVSRSGSHEPLAALITNGPNLPETTATTTNTTACTPAFDRMRSQNSDTVSLTSISSRTSRGNGNASGNTPNISENRRPSGASNQRSSSPSGSVTFGIGIDGGEAYYSPPADADEIPDGNQSPGTADLDFPHFGAVEQQQQYGAGNNRNSSEAPAAADATLSNRGRSSTATSIEVVDASSCDLRHPASVSQGQRQAPQAPGPGAELETSGLTASVEESWQLVSHSHVDPANLICTDTRTTGRSPSASPALAVAGHSRSPPPVNSSDANANPQRHRFKLFSFLRPKHSRHPNAKSTATATATARATSTSANGASRPSLPCQLPPSHSNRSGQSPPRVPARPAPGLSPPQPGVATGSASGAGVESAPRCSLPTNNLNPNFVRGIYSGGATGAHLGPLQISTNLPTPTPPRPPPRPSHGPCPHTAAVADGGVRTGVAMGIAASTASSSSSSTSTSRAPPYPQQTFLPYAYHQQYGYPEPQPPPPPPHTFPLPPGSSSVAASAAGGLQTQQSCPPALDHQHSQHQLHQLQQLRGPAFASRCTRVSHAPLALRCRCRCRCLWLSLTLNHSSLFSHCSAQHSSALRQRIPVLYCTCKLLVVVYYTYCTVRVRVPRALCAVLCSVIIGSQHNLRHST